MQSPRSTFLNKHETPKTKPQPLNFFDIKLLMNVQKIRPQKFLKKFETPTQVTSRPITAFNTFFLNDTKICLKKNEKTLTSRDEFEFKNFNSKKTKKISIDHIPQGQFIKTVQKIIQTPLKIDKESFLKDNILITPLNNKNLNQKYKNLLFLEDLKKKIQSKATITETTRVSTPINYISNKEKLSINYLSTKELLELKETVELKNNPPKPIKMHTKMKSLILNSNITERKKSMDVKQKTDIYREELNPWRNISDSMNDSLEIR